MQVVVLRWQLIDRIEYYHHSILIIKTLTSKLFLFQVILTRLDAALRNLGKLLIKSSSLGFSILLSLAPLAALISSYNRESREFKVFDTTDAPVIQVNKT